MGEMELSLVMMPLPILVCVYVKRLLFRLSLSMETGSRRLSSWLHSKCTDNAGTVSDVDSVPQLRVQDGDRVTWRQCSPPPPKGLVASQHKPAMLISLRNFLICELGTKFQIKKRKTNSETPCGPRRSFPNETCPHRLAGREVATSALKLRLVSLCPGHTAGRTLMLWECLGAVGYWW